MTSMSEEPVERPRPAWRIGPGLTALCALAGTWILQGTALVVLDSLPRRTPPGTSSIGTSCLPWTAYWLIGEAIEFHIEGLIAEGDPVPEPRATAEYVEA